MGYKYEVYYFTLGAGYVPSYAGQWLILALHDMWKLREKECVKLERR